MTICRITVLRSFWHPAPFDSFSFCLPLLLASSPLGSRSIGLLLAPVRFKGRFFCFLLLLATAPFGSFSFFRITFLFESFLFPLLLAPLHFDLRSIWISLLLYPTLLGFHSFWIPLLLALVFEALTTYVKSLKFLVHTSFCHPTLDTQSSIEIFFELPLRTQVKGEVMCSNFKTTVMANCMRKVQQRRGLIFSWLARLICLPASRSHFFAIICHFQALLIGM